MPGQAIAGAGYRRGRLSPEVQTAEGKLYLYVAIDRTSKFAVVQLVRKTGRASASAFLEAVIQAFAYKIHAVLTDN